jgi:hypothetical protein
MRRVTDPSLYESHLPEDSRILYRIAVDEQEYGEVHLISEEKDLLTEISPGTTVAEACGKSSFPEAEFKRILFRLLASGLLRSSKGGQDSAEGVQIEDLPKLHERIEQCNIIFRLVTEYVRAAVGDRVHVILGAFFRGIDHGQDILFENVSLELDGSLDPRSLLVNISEYLPEEREAILIRGLNELLYFQLFAVRNNLGPDQEQQVISALREMEFLK